MELGDTSLLPAKAQQVLERELGTGIAVTALFDHTRLIGLSARQQRTGISDPTADAFKVLTVADMTRLCEAQPGKKQT
ncbi:hypothetical protein [Stappia stellulata]|uniref:hypothetical protein n=1 Tax=Stappia stellulata TaxID=71235 RepID=UPI000418A562|nr:hypothetical protein [Stappia stellulata]